MIETPIGVMHRLGNSRYTAGFTLVELAIAMFIIALLLGSILVPLATQVEQRQISETQKKQDDINEALAGFAVANGYLPCPAISATNGLEDRTAGVCTASKRQGYLPWETLGVSKLDAWGRIYRYSVTLAFASATTPFTLSTSPDITIRTRDSAGALVNLTNANSVPVVVLSQGKNGYGATDNQGTALALPAAWPANYPDENTNASGSTTFVSRTAQAESAAGSGGEFDDMVIWQPRYVLLNRMVAAGKLP
jgi:prepilin-type N-terminal cleavage/methylation domain-containing protein